MGKESLTVPAVFCSLFHVASFLLDVALSLVLHAFKLLLGTADNVADVLLNLARNFLRLAFYLVLVHFEYLAM